VQPPRTPLISDPFFCFVPVKKRPQLIRAKRTNCFGSCRQNPRSLFPAGKAHLLHGSQSKPTIVHACQSGVKNSPLFLIETLRPGDGRKSYTVETYSDKCHAANAPREGALNSPASMDTCASRAISIRLLAVLVDCSDWSGTALLVGCQSGLEHTFGSRRLFPFAQG